jgi:hypothetical protein
MKYICNHETTLKTLRRWAGAEPLFTASFFFWNSGYPMQKSQVGLLQSLLYQVLCACPALIMEVCPLKGPREPWKRRELFEALDKVSKQTALPAKFCFFVDGLDEYEGDDEDIIALLQDLVSSPNIKICVSSRPWNAFLDAFDDSEWKLVLEELTRDDMQKYVHTMLVQNKAFARMSKHDFRCKTLVPQIAQKAQGVWLWVYLVVRDLLRDLRGEEEFPLLQRRLDSFPEELERYFESILDHIDKIHREESARIFWVAVTAVKPFPLLSLHYLSMESANKDYAIQLESSQLSPQEAFQIKKKWRKLLNSRCRDLLEVDQACLQENLCFLEGRVDFLHRTVRDFLRNNYADELRKRVGDGFDARSALCKTILSLNKVQADSIIPPNSTLYNPSIPNFDLVDEMLLYAKDFERAEAQSLASLLDELDRVSIIRFNSDNWTSQRKQHVDRGGKWLLYEYGDCTFLALAIQAGLRVYVKEKLELNNTLIAQKRGCPLLDYACRPKRTSTILSQLEQDDVFDPQMVRLLLEHGSDPNQPMGRKYFEVYTIMDLFISNCYETYTLEPIASSRRVTDMWYEAVELMIDHGAISNLNVQIELVDFIGKFERINKGRNIRTMSETIFGDEQTIHLALRMEEVAQRHRSQTSNFWRLLGWI